MQWWIGDRVRVRKLGEFGIFEGLDSPGMAKVKRQGGEIMLIAIDELSLIDEDQLPCTPPVAQDKEVRDPLQLMLNFNSSLDLHIASLRPDLEHGPAAQILGYQKQRCAQYLKDAIRAQQRRCTIIHGKGAGVLRSEVLQLIAERPEIISWELTPDGGAVVVYFD